MVLRGKVTFKDFIDMGTEQTEQFRLLGSEFGYFVINHEALASRSVKCEASDFVHRDFPYPSCPLLDAEWPRCGIPAPP